MIYLLLVQFTFAFITVPLLITIRFPSDAHAGKVKPLYWTTGGITYYHR